MKEFRVVTGVVGTRIIIANSTTHCFCSLVILVELPVSCLKLKEESIALKCLLSELFIWLLIMSPVQIHSLSSKATLDNIGLKVSLEFSLRYLDESGKL